MLDEPGKATNLQPSIPGRAGRGCFKWFALLVALFILTILALAPRVMSSNWFYAPLLARLEAGRFRLQVDKVQLKWFSPISLHGIAVYPMDQLETISQPADNTEALPAQLIADFHSPIDIDTPVIRIRSIQTDRSILGFLLSGRSIGRLELNQPEIDIRLVDQSSNLKKIVDAVRGAPDPPAENSKPIPKSFPKLDVDLAVRQLSVSIRSGNDSEPLVIIPHVDLDLHYRSLNSDSILKLQPSTLLNQVELTPELMRLGLEFAVPVLAKSAWLDGRVSLKTETIQIPLDVPWRTQGKAALTFHEVRAGLNEPALMSAVQLLAKWMNREPHDEILIANNSVIQVEISEGFVTHQGLQLGLPRLDPRMVLHSSGKVGIQDRSLNLLIDLPVPVAQLARRETVRELGVPTMQLPITGSLDAPQVQWGAMRQESAKLLESMREKVANESPATAAVLGTLESIASGDADEVIDAAAQVLRNIRDQREKRRLEAEQSQDEEQAPAPRTRPGLNRLREILRGR